jgi:hypothetical protein
MRIHHFFCIYLAFLLQVQINLSRFNFALLMFLETMANLVLFCTAHIIALSTEFNYRFLSIVIWNDTYSQTFSQEASCLIFGMNIIYSILRNNPTSVSIFPIVQFTVFEPERNFLVCAIKRV